VAIFSGLHNLRIEQTQLLIQMICSVLGYFDDYTLVFFFVILFTIQSILDKKTFYRKLNLIIVIKVMQ
jgi:hypothetical protein